MASSSSIRNYDVFLSFRGEDTRNTFTSHLNDRLFRKGINTFIDKRLEKGSTISVELIKAIEESQVAVVILSKDFASSHWCLDELVKIMECKIHYKLKVIPVFLIDPSVVRHQKRRFGKFLTDEEAKYDRTDNVEGKHKVQGWRKALTEVALLKGHDIRNRDEADCITKIADQISKKLRKTRPLSSVQDVVGFDIHLEKLMALLDMETNDVRIVGIWGMGGIGKTAIAKALFDTLLYGTPSNYQFDASCFLDNVNEEVKSRRMPSVQKTLLSTLLEEEVTVNDKYNGKDLLSTRLQSKKVLIVLDDIDDREQVEFLAGNNPDWFNEGSRIIVTTRDQRLIGGNIYEVPLLTAPLDIQLFNRYAFKFNEVPGEPFEELSRDVLNCADGLPLALRVFACMLKDRNIEEWRSAVKSMKKSSESLEIVERLKISYDILKPQEQEVFLHIACLYRGHPIDELMQILESCSVEALIVLHVLIEKSLVFMIRDWRGKRGLIQMHDIMQEMGKHVVESLKKDGDECSRIWRHEDFKRMMKKNTGKTAVEAIRIVDTPSFKMSKNAMRKMNKLRILHIEQSDFWDTPLTCDGDSIECLPDSLHWFRWDYYPSKSLPDNFEPEYLVHLELVGSWELRQLWTEQKNLPKLKKIILRGSRHLEETPDFTMIPNLEYLDLSCCTRLQEVHHSLGNCRKLTNLDLSYCRRLKEVHHSLGNCRKLTKLDLRSLKNIVALPSCIGKLEELVKLDVTGCKRLESLPEEIGDLTNLEELLAKYTLISEAPSSIVRLTKLKHLSFAKHKSKFREALPHFVFPRESCRGLFLLEELDLDYCNLIDGRLLEDIRSLSSLQVLRLRGNHFDHLPRSIVDLRALRILDLKNSEKLKELPELPPNIEILFADYHLAQRSIQNLATKNMKLQLMTFTSVSTVDQFEVRSDYDELACESLFYYTSDESNDVPDEFSDVPPNAGIFSTPLDTFWGKSCLVKPNADYLDMPNADFFDLPNDGTGGESSGESNCDESNDVPDGEFSDVLPNADFLDVPNDVSNVDQINELLAETLSRCILSLEEAFSASDSPQRSTFTLKHFGTEIPRLFNLEGVATHNDLHIVNLPKDWYVKDNFLGFAVCFIGNSNYNLSLKKLTLLSNDDKSEQMSVTLGYSKHVCEIYNGAYFLFVPFDSSWDTSKANRETPNDYGLLKLEANWKIEKFGVRLLNKKPVSAGKSRSGYDDDEHLDSSSKKQRLNPQQQVERPTASGTSQHFRENAEF